MSSTSRATEALSSRPVLSVRTSSESAANEHDAAAMPRTPHAMPSSTSQDEVMYDSPMQSVGSREHDAATGSPQQPASNRRSTATTRHRRLDSTVTSSKIFDQLDVIKKLQNDITQAHAAIEGVGLGPAVGQQQHGQQNVKDWPFKSSSDMENDKSGPDGLGGKAAAAGATSGAAADLAQSASSQTYQDMAKDFDKRQEGVERIMAKLTDLSNALKELHSLPSPVLFPSSEIRHRHHANHNPGSPGSPVRPSAERASSEK
ncbi:hypothetical protein ACM66B_006208 [Microbotryomycetes sp. NB124-2]